MKKNNEVIRTCIVCRSKKDKSELVRIVSSDGKICVDNTGKMPGRGCYVCDSAECKDKLKKFKALNKTFKTNIQEEIYDRIRSELQ